MGSMASAKIVALPMVEKHSDPEPAVAAVRSSAAEVPAAETAAGAPAPVAAAEIPVPEPEPIPTVSLTEVLRSLLAKITRERIITAALACISIGALFLFWYVGTKYRLEFYIRFKNVPTPYEVYQQLTQVGLSNKYLVNIAISVRRILLGFFIAMAIGVPLGLAIGKYRARARPVHARGRDHAADPGDRLGTDVDHAVAEQRGQHRLHHLHRRLLPDPAQHHPRRAFARRRVGAGGALPGRE